MNSQLFVHFVIADEAQYLVKSMFNQLKKKILTTEGTLIGYDIKEIRIKCKHCKGTGKITIKKFGAKPKNNECPTCKGSTYFKHEDRYLERYKLNDLIFHLPINKKPVGEPTRIISESMESFGIDPKLVYKSLLILFACYDESLLAKLLEIAIPANDIWSKNKDKILQSVESIKTAA